MQVQVLIVRNSLVFVSLRSIDPGESLVLRCPVDDQAFGLKYIDSLSCVAHGFVNLGLEECDL